MTTISPAPANSTTARLTHRLRNEIRNRRQSRDAYRSLERELASYRTRSDIDDLLSAVDRQGDSPQAEQIRGILTQNSTDFRRTHRLAS